MQTTMTTQTRQPADRAQQVITDTAALAQLYLNQLFNKVGVITEKAKDSADEAIRMAKAKELQAKSNRNKRIVMFSICAVGAIATIVYFSKKKA